jgi:hypothetical protein
MSSGFQYNPKPPRVWSRVQNRCSTNNDNSSLVYVPLTNQTMTQAEANYKTQMYNKGNVLQYKNNSSSLTKQQKYALMAKGKWVGKKSYATQSETYTNPNTTSLLRANYSNIPFPNVIVGYPNNISGPFQYNVTNPFDCSTNLLQDGGNLVCNAVVNHCSGEIIQTFKEEKCFPTTCSNVPGKIQDLCWDPKIQTWLPKNRTNMNNSGTKWPEGYKGLVSAVKPAPPTILTIYGGCGTIDITWSYAVCNCLPISYFYIFIDNTLLKIVSYEYTSTTITDLNFNTKYSIYIKSTSNKIQSDKSNILTTTTLPLPSAPSNLTGSAGCGFIDISWNVVTGSCDFYYNIYVNNGLYEYLSSSITSTTLYNLNYNTTYSIYIKTAVINGNGSEPGKSNILTLTTSSLTTPILTINKYETTPSVMFDLSYNSNTGCTTNPYGYKLYYSTNEINYNVIYIDGSGSSLQNYTYDVLYNYNYAFYLKYVSSNGNLSDASSLVTVDTTIYPVTDLTSTSISQSSVYLSWNAPDSSFCTGYDISYNSIFTSIDSSSNTYYTITGLSSNTLYTFDVYAKYNTYLSTSVSTTITTPYGYNISASGFNTDLSTYSNNSITNVHDTSGVLVFTSSGGTLDFTFYDGSLNYLIVSGGGGGGGGGGGSWDDTVSSQYAGLGGGGGGGNVTRDMLYNGYYNLTVGSGGGGGNGGSGSYYNPLTTTNGSHGNSGGTTYLTPSSSSLSTISISGGSYGGGGGAVNEYTGLNGQGTSGSAGTSSNGGGGGRGDGYEASGDSTGDSGQNPYFNFTVNYIYYIYTGGGGGGALIANRSGGSGGGPNGASGGNCFNGTSGNSGSSANWSHSSSSNTFSIYVGGGGGGGGASISSSTASFSGNGLSGGSGAQGIIIVWWGATS